MLKASSLLYAIFICLVVSLICGSLILIFNYQYRLKQQFFLENELILFSENSFLKITDRLNTSEAHNDGNILSDDNTIITTYTHAKWGFYDLIKTKTYHKGDTVYKIGLVGSRSKNMNLALYLTDFNTALKVGGDTKIIGDMKISRYGIEQAYINNQKPKEASQIQGLKLPSKKQLPKLNISPGDSSFIEDELYYEELKYKSSYNSFYEPTIRVVLNGITDLEDIQLSGNYIIESQDSLSVSETARLNDVLIKAPKVTFSSGFDGTVQTFAEEGVHVMKDVKLRYPSSIYINNDDEDNSLEVFMDQDSKLAGGIVLTGNTYEGSLNRLVTIETNAQVLGDIYCYGKTQLKGRVIGTVYTDHFYLKTAGSTYEDHIQNGVINKLEQPNNFIGLPLFNNDTRVYELIKEL